MEVGAAALASEAQTTTERGAMRGMPTLSTFVWCRCRCEFRCVLTLLLTICSERHCLAYLYVSFYNADV